MLGGMGIGFLMLLGVILVCSLLQGGCATPSAPTGKTHDRTGNR